MRVGIGATLRYGVAGHGTTRGVKSFYLKSVRKTRAGAGHFKSATLGASIDGHAAEVELVLAPLKVWALEAWEAPGSWKAMALVWERQVAKKPGGHSKPVGPATATAQSLTEVNGEMLSPWKVQKEARGKSINDRTP